jgi:hypothetical protein
MKRLRRRPTDYRTKAERIPCTTMKTSSKSADYLIRP